MLQRINNRRSMFALLFAVCCGTVVSNAADVRLGGEKPLRYRKQHAVVIGINYDTLEPDAQVEVPRLSTAENDAQAVRDMLVDHYGFQADDVHLLLGKDATLQGIHAQFGSSFLGDSTRVQSNDAVLIFYAGHGVRQQRHSEQESFVGMLYPVDLHVIPGKGVDPVTCLRIDDMLRMLQDYCPAHHKLVILDSCHSGEVFNFQASRAGGVNRGLRETLFHAPALQAIAAAQATQVASDADETGEHSPFTNVLLDALQHGPSGTDNPTLFTASELFAFIPTRIRQLKNVSQDPRGGWLDGEGDFYFFPNDLSAVSERASYPETTTAIATPVASTTVSVGQGYISRQWLWTVMTATICAGVAGRWYWWKRLAYSTTSTASFCLSPPSPAPQAVVDGSSTAPSAVDDRNETVPTLPELKAFDERAVPQPGPDDLPKTIVRSRIMLATALLLFGVAANGYLVRVDRNQQLQAWSQECQNRFSSPVPGDTSNWHSLPSGMIERSSIYLATDNASDLRIANTLAESLAVEVADQQEVTRSQWQSVTYPAVLSGTGNRMGIEITNEFSQLKIDVSYYMRTQQQMPAFQFTARRGLTGLYGQNILIFAMGCLIVFAVDAGSVAGFRGARRLKYQTYTAKRTEWLYLLRERMLRAEICLEQHDVQEMQRLCHDVLRVAPNFPDALALLAKAADTDSDQNSHINSGELYLQVTGSPYAYRAQHGATTITVGRQKRKADLAGNEGNDFVIRVPGSETKTRLLSRRHLQIDRIGHDYFVIDRSSAGTRLNGRDLPRDQPTPLMSGDRLLVGTVLTLEVVLRRDTFVSEVTVNSAVEMTPWNNPGVVVEASLGDVVTIEHD